MTEGGGWARLKTVFCFEDRKIQTLSLSITGMLMRYGPASIDSIRASRQGKQGKAMGRYQRLWWSNILGMLAILSIMAIFPVGLLYSLIFQGKLSAESFEWVRVLGLAAKHSASPFQHWLWRGVQLVVLMSPLSLWLGRPLLGRLSGNVTTINEIENLRRRRRELIEAEKRRRGDCSAAARAREVARQNYPEYISRPELEEDESWGDDRLIEDLLDPAEVVLRYPRQNGSAHGELRLYDRSRVASIMTSEEYRRRIAEVRQRRWEEEERDRRQEKIDRIERHKRDELDRRLASQKIVYITGAVASTGSSKQQ